MKYTVLSLFPRLLKPWTEEALLGRAAKAGLIEFALHDLRTYTQDKHRSVDDTPYGGGAGMVIRVDVVARALRALQEEDPADEVILLAPAGVPFTQRVAEELATKRHLLLVAGRYEGFDARVDNLATRELSIGDFVLMGGEIAALAVIEATARLLPGVLGDADSHAHDSFSSGLLDYPDYTRPPVFEGESVPEVLMSGHHARIARWRRERALERTRLRRPELLEGLELSDDDRAFLAGLEEKP